LIAITTIKVNVTKTNKEIKEAKETIAQISPNWNVGTSKCTQDIPNQELPEKGFFPPPKKTQKYGFRLSTK